MAALNNRKRRQNVRSNSSCSSIGSNENACSSIGSNENACSSIGSNENGIETGYISDNSTSDIDLGSRPSGKKGKFGLPARNTNQQLLPQCNVLKKEFVLKTGKRFNDSDETDYMSSRKRAKCLSKNAIMARMNRMRKKQYLDDLEKKLDEMSKENAELKDKVQKNDEIVKKLNDELTYLKCVLANSREISMLLKSVRHNSGLPVTSSINKYAENDIFKTDSLFEMGFPDEPVFSSGDFVPFSGTDVLEPELCMKSTELEENSSSNIGICLHVAKHRVSLEFCPTCSHNASTSGQNG